MHIAITVGVLAFIFVQSAMPGHASSTESNLVVRVIAWITGLDPLWLKPIVRKCAHFLEYFVLGGCLTVNVRDRGLVHGREVSRWISWWRTWALAWIASAAYAVTDEIHQAFVPRRACTFTDVCIDSAGAAVGALVMVLWLWLTGCAARRRSG